MQITKWIPLCGYQSGCAAALSYGGRIPAASLHQLLASKCAAGPWSTPSSLPSLPPGRCWAWRWWGCGWSGTSCFCSRPPLAQGGSSGPWWDRRRVRWCWWWWAKKTKKSVAWRGKKPPTTPLRLKNKNRIENSIYRRCANNPSSWERAGFLDTPQEPVGKKPDGKKIILMIIIIIIKQKKNPFAVVSAFSACVRWRAAAASGAARSPAL